MDIWGLGVSALLHAVVLAALCVAAPVPRPQASIEVVFGLNDVPAKSIYSYGRFAAAHSVAGGTAGLDIARDPAVIEAKVDPGNRAPPYPAAAQAQGEAGSVIWRIAVDRNGRADHLAMMQSSGFGDLDDAARAALLTWRFVPARRGGSAVASSIDMTIDFVLDARR